MGTILTSYGDAGYDHEGYPDRRMPSGEYSGGEWSARYPPDAHVAFVAACACGWRGSSQHPPGDEGEERALAEWEHAHARPVLQRAQDAELQRLQEELGHIAVGIAAPGAARERAERLARLASRLETATDLAWRLHHQHLEQADQAEQAEQRP